MSRRLERVDLGDGAFAMWDPETLRLYPDGTPYAPVENQERPRLHLVPGCGPDPDLDVEARAALDRAQARAAERVQAWIGAAPTGIPDPDPCTAAAVYVAGPMRGLPGFNFPAFDEAADLLQAMGYMVCNPADRDRAAHGDISWGTTVGDEAEVTAQGFSLREALGWDLSWIAAHADAIAVLPGWESSRGARAEVALAQALGLLVAPIEAFTCHELPWHAAISDPVSDQAAPAPAAADGEVRVTSSTGGEKGSKLARFDLIPTGPLNTLAMLYGRGAQKYAPHNWTRGYDWSLSFAALQRHAWAFWAGEDMDEELQLPHLASVAWHAFTLMHFMQHPEQYGRFDDRYRGTGEATA